MIQSDNPIPKPPLPLSEEGQFLSEEGQFLLANPEVRFEDAMNTKWINILLGLIFLALMALCAILYFTTVELRNSNLNSKEKSYYEGVNESSISDLKERVKRIEDERGDEARQAKNIRLAQELTKEEKQKNKE